MEDQNLNSIRLSSIGLECKSGNTLYEYDPEFLFQENYFDKYFIKPEKLKQLCFEWLHSIKMTVKKKVKCVKRKIVSIVQCTQLPIIF